MEKSDILLEKRNFNQNEVTQTIGRALTWTCMTSTVLEHSESGQGPGGHGLRYICCLAVLAHGRVIIAIVKPRSKSEKERKAIVFP